MLYAPNTATGMLTPARLLIWYTVALFGSSPTVQVYDACLQFVFPSSTGGQTSYWQ